MNVSPENEDDDLTLLRRWAEERSEKTFRALAGRFAPLVWGAALRKTGDPGLAEEAAQQVFIDLAAKASTLAALERPLAPWLHRAAIFEAAQALRRELRHRERVKRFAEINPPGAAAPDPRENARPRLDDALDSLNEADRRLLLLHWYERRTFAEAAAILGCTPAAAQRRGLRALEKLASAVRRPAGRGPDANPRASRSRVGHPGPLRRFRLRGSRSARLRAATFVLRHVRRQIHHRRRRASLRRAALRLQAGGFRKRQAEHPAAVAGLPAGTLLSVWMKPDSPRAEAPAPRAAVEASGLPHGVSAAFRELVNRRAPLPSVPESEVDAVMKLTGISERFPASPVRAGLEAEVFRSVLPAERVTGNFFTDWMPEGSPGAVELMGRLARIKPALALAETDRLLMRDRKNQEEAEGMRRRVFREWLRNDPRAALSEAVSNAVSQNLNHSDCLRSLNLQALMTEWSRLDPAAAAAALRTLPEGEPDLDRRDLAQTLFRGWYERDPAAALAWAQTEADPAWRETLTTLNEELTANDPAAKTAALLAAPERDGNRLAIAFSDWLAADAPAALAKLSAIPPEDAFWTRDAARVSAWWAINARSGMTPEQLVETINSIPEGAPLEAILQGLADYGAGNDIPFAVRIIDEMSEGQARAEAMSNLTEQWMRKDPAALSEWLAAQPDRDSRHGAASRFAQLLAKSDPEAAARWTDTLPDDYWQKEETARTVREAWLAVDPAATEAWRAE